jgi:hypothetical protein
LAHGSIAGSAVIALGGVIAGPPLIDWLLGSEFESAAEALAPALAAVPLAPIAALGAHHALLDCRPAARVGLAAVGATVFVVAALVLLSSGSDATEVALATLAGAAAAAAAAAVYARPPLQMTGAAVLSAAAVWGIGALVA